MHIFGNLNLLKYFYYWTVYKRCFCIINRFHTGGKFYIIKRNINNMFKKLFSDDRIEMKMKFSNFGIFISYNLSDRSVNIWKEKNIYLRSFSSLCLSIFKPFKFTIWILTSWIKSIHKSKYICIYIFIYTNTYCYVE